MYRSNKLKYQLLLHFYHKMNINFTPSKSIIGFPTKLINYRLFNQVNQLSAFKRTIFIIR